MDTRRGQSQNGRNVVFRRRRGPSDERKSWRALCQTKHPPLHPFVGSCFNPTALLDTHRDKYQKKEVVTILTIVVRIEGAGERNLASNDGGLSGSGNKRHLCVRFVTREECVMQVGWFGSCECRNERCCRVARCFWLPLLKPANYISLCGAAMMILSPP